MMKLPSWVVACKAFLFADGHLLAASSHDFPLGVHGERERILVSLPLLIRIPVLPD